MDEIKPSNAQLAEVATQSAADFFFLTRGYGLNLEERNRIFDAAYGAFNSATAAYARAQARKAA